MPDDAGGGGLFSRHEVPGEIERALATIRDYIAAERQELRNLRSVNGDVIRNSSDDQDVAVLAACELTLLESGVANIAANKRRRDTGLAREELKQELRTIDARHGLSAPDADSINAMIRAAIRAEVAKWQLKQECRDIDAKYRISQLAQELSRLSSVVADLGDAIGQIDRHYPPGTGDAWQLSSGMLRDINAIYNAAGTLRTKIKEIAVARGTYPPSEVLTSGVWWHGSPPSGHTLPSPTGVLDSVQIAQQPAQGAVR